MKKLLFILTAVSSFIAHGQQYVYNKYDNGISLCEFQLVHLDSITKFTSDTVITAAVRFSTEGALESVNYYRGSYYDFDADDFQDKEVTVWPGLDAFIKNQYPFLPDSHYHRELSRLDLLWFTMHFTKEGIQNDLGALKEAKKANDECGTYFTGSYGPFDILPNAGFNLQVKRLVIDGKALPLKNIAARLQYLDSGVVKLAPEVYLIFKVLKTSENGSPVNYLEYKLFVVKKGQAMLYVKEGQLDINEKTIDLDVAGNREYWEDEGGNVTATRGYGYGTTPEVGLVVGTETFDVELNITFVKP